MLFTEQVSRKPNLYPWTQQFIDAIWESFWTPNEFNFRSDYSQFHTELTDEQREVIVRTLSAIGQIEIAVKTFWANLGRNLPHPGLTDLGFVMAQNEVIHNQAYEKLLDVLHLQDVFEKNLQEDVVAARVNYLRKYMDKVYEDDRKQYVYALILFTLFVENVSLFSQFLIVMHFNRFHNVLKDTAQQVEYTRNEEQLHAQVGVKIINTLREEYPELFDEALEARVREEAMEALTAEGNVIDWIMGDYREPNLNPEILKAYIANRINGSLADIGFDVTVPVDASLLPPTRWMDEEALGGSITDFFQKRPVDYGKGTQSFDAGDLF
ncbi:ribonucleotide-diphosphate reductase subunit beta [Epibacterium sp. MM17-32]|uniref:ribonucleotide-diphosphate reductase subunit beta n=1 Tax=Epibacterium sp. MM17-32 TaxID=2917734 RepID=UPI001EF72366|nr:ribonucleotide-diphosphate reductase subunit beta [Epibacterium sp. MM17-32]MCG7628972.1 ribonucleotide-diphosphate reductase subunit beta [Epibacterium sp. MM17-32]